MLGQAAAEQTNAFVLPPLIRETIFDALSEPYSLFTLHYSLPEDVLDTASHYAGRVARAGGAVVR